jgi:hypothetical protein
VRCLLRDNNVLAKLVRLNIERYNRGKYPCVNPAAPNALAKAPNAFPMSLDPLPENVCRSTMTERSQEPGHEEPERWQELATELTTELSTEESEPEETTAEPEEPEEPGEECWEISVWQPNTLLEDLPKIPWTELQLRKLDCPECLHIWREPLYVIYEGGPPYRLTWM